jgi:hypothetical protein
MLLVLSALLPGADCLSAPIALQSHELACVGAGAGVQYRRRLLQLVERGLGSGFAVCLYHI